MNALLHRCGRKSQALFFEDRNEVFRRKKSSARSLTSISTPAHETRAGGPGSAA